MFYTLWSLKCAMNTWFLPPLFFSITNNTSIKHLCTVLVYLWKYTRVKGTCISSKKSLSQFIIHSQKHYRYLCPYNLANTGYYPFPTATDNSYFLHELPIDIFCPFLHEVIQLCLIDLGDLLKHYFIIAIFVLKC